MPNKNQTNYQDEVARLQLEVASLQQQLHQEQFDKKNYQNSISKAQKSAANTISPRELNPILKQIRNKNLSVKERQTLLFPNVEPSPPEDIYYQWVGPVSISVKRDKQWYWTMGLVLMIMITIAVIFREVMWIAVILAFFFALYVNASIPQQDTVYKLTRQGIEVGEGDSLEIYAWEQLLEYSFYFKHNTEILYVDTLLAVPQRIQLIFTQEDRKNITMIMESNLPYKLPPKKQGWLLKYVDGIYIPLTDFKALQEKIDQYYDNKYAEIIFQLKQEGKIPQNVSVEDVRRAESMETMKLTDEIRRKQEEDAKKILGI